MELVLALICDLMASNAGLCNDVLASCKEHNKGEIPIIVQLVVIIHSC